MNNLSAAFRCVGRFFFLRFSFSLWLKGKPTGKQKRLGGGPPPNFDTHPCKLHVSQSLIPLSNAPGLGTRLRPLGFAGFFFSVPPVLHLVRVLLPKALHHLQRHRLEGLLERRPGPGALTSLEISTAPKRRKRCGLVLGDCPNADFVVIGGR